MSLLLDFLHTINGQQVTQTAPTVVNKTEPNPNAGWYIAGGIVLALGLAWLIFHPSSPLKKMGGTPKLA